MWVNKSQFYFQPRWSKRDEIYLPTQNNKYPDNYMAHLISFPSLGDYIAGCYCFIYFVWIFVVLGGKVNLVPFAPSWLKIKLAFIYSHLTPVPFYLYWSYRLKLFSFILSYFFSIFWYTNLNTMNSLSFGLQ